MNVTEIEVSCLFSSTSVVKLEKMIVMAALKRYVNDTDGFAARVLFRVCSLNSLTL